MYVLRILVFAGRCCWYGMVVDLLLVSLSVVYFVLLYCFGFGFVFVFVLVGVIFVGVECVRIYI